MSTRMIELKSEMNCKLMINPVYVFVTLSGKRRIGKVVRFNFKTTWVKVMIGARSSIIIKRKNNRDNVQVYKIGEAYETIHTTVKDKAQAAE